MNEMSVLDVICQPSVCMSCALHLLLTSAVTLSPHQHQFLSEALQWRAQTDPDHILYVLLNAKVDWPHDHPH